VKLRSDTDVQTFLDAELAWRLKELHHTRELVRSGVAPQRQRMVLRAAIPLLYAHWEGFVKVAAEGLLNFVSNQRHRYRELRPCFVAHGIKLQLGHLTESKQHVLRSEAVRFVMAELDTVAAVPWKGIVSARSNLNSEVLADILAALGLSSAPYETRYKLIDESLVARRNKIAHGEWLELDQASCEGLIDEVLTLLRIFKTDVENCVATKSYLATLPAARSSGRR
jgi:MAE_28990/MAE_18760-like HEPN